MRRDMPKVIVERPAHKLRIDRGVRIAKRLKLGRVGADDSISGRVGNRTVKRRWAGDLLGPLRRYLNANLNRPWDKVYSEICAEADSRSVVGWHLRDHLCWLVDLHCVEQDRKIYRLHHFGGRQLVKGFYVHPRTGLLRRA